MASAREPLRLIYRDPADLVPHPRNPRLHTDKAMAHLTKAIQRFGWTAPILTTTDGQVLAGHARLRAARQLGLATVPVIALPLSGADADAYLIADNRLTEEGEWDRVLLAELLEEIGHQVEDLAVTGFEDRDLAPLLDRLEQETVESSTDALEGGWRVTVECANETDQRTLLERLQAEGYSCRASVL